MIDERKYKAIIWICSIVFLPVGIFLLLRYLNWKKNNSEQQLLKLEKSLRTGVGFVFVFVCVVCFMFYQYGRHFISVMGTFY